MSNHPINMWPGGEINRAATNDELRESPLCRSVRWDGRSTLLAVAFKDK